MPLFRSAAAFAALCCAHTSLAADASDGSVVEPSRPSTGFATDAGWTSSTIEAQSVLTLAYDIDAEGLAEYPDRWCLKQSPTHRRRMAAIALQPSSRRSYRSMGGAPGHNPPSAMTLSARATATTADELRLDTSGNDQSLLDRIRSIDSHRLATLWRGKERALFVGLQSGRYFGVSLERKDADAERDEPQRGQPKTF